jgi:hypothetical protein
MVIAYVSGRWPKKLGSFPETNPILGGIYGGEGSERSQLSTLNAQHSTLKERVNEDGECGYKAPTRGL